MDRQSVRGYLRALLASPTAGCARDELAALTEAQLGELLGPLWAVRVARPPQPRAAWRDAVAHHNCLAWADVLQTYTSALFGAQRRRTPHVLPHLVALAGGPPSPLAALTRLVAGLPPAAEPAVAPRCHLCEREGPGLPRVALRPCERAARCGRHFHFSCALLAGADRCLVVGLEDYDTALDAVPLDGEAPAAAAGGEKRRRAEPVEVWCGECHRRERRRGH
ncbi:hypothetical protein STCU_11936 [Strigomonas culicis]|uniref:Uncharacterized protein n=1 Tax=Strigomonas culicis TaxID=28005 RepID=S9UYE2_9TRYP|nr:hypothetical protein STCU_11936 [Strigomonas culicis]|eukprot:EPY15550.1 hypothetical protein STCU_11936 [Strigomonas culicis]